MKGLIKWTKHQIVLKANKAIKDLKSENKNLKEQAQFYLETIKLLSSRAVDAEFKLKAKVDTTMIDARIKLASQMGQLIEAVS